jgi:hypothetical protein
MPRLRRAYVSLCGVSEFRREKMVQDLARVLALQGVFPAHEEEAVGISDFCVERFKAVLSGRSEKVRFRGRRKF